MKPTITSVCSTILFDYNYAQTTIDDRNKKMVTEVNGDTVRKLVSFGTRHTLSDTKAILAV
jgi:hypothetical protein